MPVSKDTATEIAFAYRELEAGEELLKHVEKALEKGETDIRDRYGRAKGLKLEVPTSSSSGRLLDLPWRLAKPVINAHLAEVRQKIETLSEAAALEMQA